MNNIVERILEQLAKHAKHETFWLNNQNKMLIMAIRLTYTFAIADFREALLKQIPNIEYELGDKMRNPK